MHMPLTPIRCLLRARDLYPGKTGIVSGTQSYTYAEFSDHCHRMAAGLLTTGAKKGDRSRYSASATTSFWKVTLAYRSRVAL